MKKRLIYELGRARELIVRSMVEFVNDDCPLLAAAVAYFALASIFPLCLLTLAGAGRILGSREAARDAITGFVVDFIPGAMGTVEMVIVALVRSQATLGVIATLGLLWTGSQIVYYLETAMNFAWDCPPRPWWKSRIRAVLLTVVGQTLLTLYFTISLVAMVANLLAKVPGHQLISTGLLESGVPWVISFLLSVFVFVSLNKVLPNHKVSWGAALFGGTISSVLFEAARYGFRHYLDNFASYDVLYGSIGGLVILLAWVYYGALITLLGAELAAEMEELYLGHFRKRCPARVGGAHKLEPQVETEPKGD